MCGRYAFTFRPSVARQRLGQQHMPVDDAPDDDDERLRQSYNFAPGYHGLIYRAETPANDEQSQDESIVTLASPPKVDGRQTHETRYKLQAAKWGLIPFWTKRPPDYAGQLKTINCRDDSLIEDKGMWNTMKKNKRCIVVAEGFYEWLKKNDGKEKLPHFVKRTDGTLMCFAGLWDAVQYEGTTEKLYTYTIITTDSNKQLKFLHDRMPVLLEPGSDEMKMWLDPNNKGWSKELQQLLKPFDGQLDCYPVDKAVGKVGNNSPSFVIPIDSPDNKKNIANFFAKQNGTGVKPVKKQEQDSRATTVKVEDTESNAPLPKPEGIPDELVKAKIEDTKEQHVGTKRGRSTSDVQSGDHENGPKPKAIKKEESPNTPIKSSTVSGRQLRSAVSNPTKSSSPVKGEDNTKITNFFGSTS